MELNSTGLFVQRAFIRLLLASNLFLITGLTALSQTVSSNPLNGATGVSPSAAVVFTFSTAVAPSATFVNFVSTDTFQNFTVTTNWSNGNTVLTCTPNPPFSANITVSWTLVVSAAPLPVVAQGSFTTGAGSGGGGIAGTNVTTLFSVGKFYFYGQTNSTSVTTNANHEFEAGVSLASNQVATAATVTFPGAGSATNLNPNASGPENFNFLVIDRTNQTDFENSFPDGNYVFNVTATPANQQVTDTLPATLVQPNAPFVSNFDAAQAIDATKDFTLTWDAFQNGTSSDAISLAVVGSSGIAFQTPSFGTSNTLKGTVKSVLIPAGTLQASSTYSCDIVFYRYVAATNATYIKIANRASGTGFQISTIGSASQPPGVSNPSWSANGLAFDVATSPSQVVTVRFSTDCSLPISQWQTLLSTNSPGTSVHITVPVQGAAGFVRLQNDP